jgi:flagellar motor switch protein FliG
MSLGIGTFLFIINETLANFTGESTKMGVYTRFKRDQDGLRKLVELLEVTPQARRQKMIDVGMTEDPDYTQKALQYVITFEDILKLNDMELAEVISDTPGRMTAYAIYDQPEEVKNRFILKASPRIAADIKECVALPGIGPAQIAGARLKLIEVTRKLEKRGAVKVKRVPS